MNGHDTFDELVAAYAIDALDREEAVAFERHLAGCATCQAALTDLRCVSAGIGLSVDRIDPPASLRARTLARATTQPQIGRVGGVTPVAAPREGTPWAWIGMAAALVLAAGLGVYADVQRREAAASRQLVAEMSGRVDELRAELTATRSESARLATTVGVMAAADVVRVDLRGQRAAPAAAGRAYASTRGLVFSASSLPPLGAGRAYQLWLIPSGAGAAPISAGLFTVDPAGASTVVVNVPTEIARIAAVAVTEEPAGGSPGPTSQLFLLGTRANN